MKKLQLLNNDASTLLLINLARKWSKVDIFVEHGIDDAQIVSNLALPMVEQSVEHAQSEFELDGGMVTQPECSSHAAQVDQEDDDLVDELQEEGDKDDEEEEGLVGKDYNFVDVVSTYDVEWARVEAESEDVGMGENEQVQSD
nr:hypothetical protein Itr_chr02CG11720 [Ipomoea trifida]